MFLLSIKTGDQERSKFRYVDKRYALIKKRAEAKYEIDNNPRSRCCVSMAPICSKRSKMAGNTQENRLLTWQIRK